MILAQVRMEDERRTKEEDNWYSKGLMLQKPFDAQAC
jgi:hypothetical protein